MISKEFEEVVQKGLEKYAVCITEEIRVRLEWEYSQIFRFGYAEKMLFLAKMREYAKQEGLLLYSRGVINCSFIAYLLGITEINPLKYGLIFERWKLSDDYKQFTSFEVAQGGQEIFDKWIEEHCEGILLPEHIFFSENREVSYQQKCLQLLAEKGWFVSFNEDFDNLETWERLCGGDVAGIEPLSSWKMLCALKRVKPNNIDDLTMLIIPTWNYKPWAWEYTYYCAEPAQIPFCEKYLKKTRGVLCYQEQLINILHHVAGYSYAEANEIRLLMGKKKQSLLEKEFEERYIPQCVNRGWNEENATSIWEACQTLSGGLSAKYYHVAMASWIYRSAYLATYFPKEYDLARNEYQPSPSEIFVRTALVVSEYHEKEIREQIQDALSKMREPKKEGIFATVGFEADGNAVEWDLTSGNLFCGADTGISMNFLGATFILFSLLSRYDRSQFGYYILTDEPSAMEFNGLKNCLGEYYYYWSRDDEKAYFIIEQILKEIEAREKCSAEELSQKPLLLVVLGNPEMWAGDNIEKLSQILEKAQSCKMACLYLSTRYSKAKESILKERFPFKYKLISKPQSEELRAMIEEDEVEDIFSESRVFIPCAIWKEEGKSIKCGLYYSALAHALRDSAEKL